MKLLLENWKNFLNENVLELDEASEQALQGYIKKFVSQNPNVDPKEIEDYVRAFNKYSTNFIKKDLNQYTWDELKTALLAKKPGRLIQPEVTTTSGVLKPIYDQNNLKIFLGDRQEKCIIIRKEFEETTNTALGPESSKEVRYNWCISRDDASNMFHTYRSQEADQFDLDMPVARLDKPVFYFIFDFDRSKQDRYHVMVIYPTTKNNTFYVSDAKNEGDKLMTWEKISEIAPKIKDLKDLFKPIPYSEKEKQTYNKVRDILSDEEFAKLTYDEKETYIALGHDLTEGQIRSSFETDKDLVNKFCAMNGGNVFIPADIYKSLPGSTKKLIDENLSSDTRSIYYLNIKEFDRRVVLRRKSIEYLPEGITFKKTLDISGTSITKIPESTKFIGDNSDFMATRTPIKELPESFSTINGEVILNSSSIEKLPNNFKVLSNLEIKNCPNLKFLPDNLVVGGSIEAEGTPLEALPENLQVHGIVLVEDIKKIKLPKKMSIGRGLFSKAHGGVNGKDFSSLFHKLRKLINPSLKKHFNLEEMIREELTAMLEEKRKLGKPSSETNLRDWFKRKGAPGKKGGWVDCNTCRDGKCKPCGRQDGEERSKYPRCRPTPAQCKGYKRRSSNLQEEK